MSDILNTIVSAIASVGYINFAIMVVASLLLWRFHPALGVLAVLFTFAVVAGLI